MRILTANLLEGRANAGALAALLVERRIDVACFQELGPAQAEAIREVLPHGLLAPGEGTMRYHGGGIAARSPLEVRRLPLPGRDAFVTELRAEQWPGLASSLALLSLHVLVPFARSYWGIQRIRGRQVRALLQYLDLPQTPPDRPRLLLGDLNSTVAWPAYRALTSRLRDLHLEHARASRRRPAGTWAPSTRGPRLWRLDHALGSGLGPTCVEVVRIEGSDHAGLIVDLGEDAARGYYPGPPPS